LCLDDPIGEGGLGAREYAAEFEPELDWIE
jgi:hypothetical protein